jgi:membrane protease YdiL (CAAX protease family)
VRTTFPTWTQQLRLTPIAWPPGAWNPWLSLLAFFVLVILNVVPAVGYVVFYNFAHLHIHGALVVTPPAFDLVILQLLTYIPVAAFLIAMIPPIARVSRAELGFRAPIKRDLLIGLWGAVVMMVVVLGSSQIMAALVHHHDSEAAVSLLKDLKTPAGITSFVLLACLCAPLIEELTFRVFFFGMLTRWLPIPAAAIISSIFFGAVHASTLPQLITIGIPLTLGGIVLTYVYATSRCYWSSVLTHAAFNTVNVTLLLVFHLS